MPATPEEILQQIGWYATGSQFLSLNLTEDQIAVLSTANGMYWDKHKKTYTPSTVEADLTAILQEWIDYEHQSTNGSQGNAAKLDGQGRRQRTG